MYTISGTASGRRRRRQEWDAARAAAARKKSGGRRCVGGPCEDYTVSRRPLGSFTIRVADHAIQTSRCLRIADRSARAGVRAVWAFAARGTLRWTDERYSGRDTAGDL